ncbi:hypothetical protein BB560_006838, partial [Smittium megazygosporum]
MEQGPGNGLPKISFPTEQEIEAKIKAMELKYKGKRIVSSDSEAVGHSGVVNEKDLPKPYRIVKPRTP